MLLRPRYKLAAGTFCALLWLTGAGGGLFALAVYGNTAGESSDPPTNWPESTAIRRSAEHGTLLVFLHPYCPCSQATLEELSRLMRQAGESLQVSVVVLGSIDAGDVRRTRLWQTAAEIPTVNLMCDLDGSESARFRARTSGAALLYDRTGRLRFHGGLTAARGQAGDNAGVDSILAIVRGKSGLTSTSVFGCPLFDADRDQTAAAPSEAKPCCK